MITISKACHLCILLLLLSLLLPTAKAQEPPRSFSIGKGAFLLHRKPFVIKAAEIHYPRIPEPYWEHRIEMCKALEMNTICLYVFWNYHEQQPDQFDFSGNENIARFCRLAQKHGMYVIVRPGPYVCAEWEMGGLPWWLLKKKDINLRSQDAYYMERVGKFMNRVGKELSELQINRGGSILMVQDIKDMLDWDISFSLYMACGGATFGHWGGANNPAYFAMCSSYDYDAPISEAGWATDNFYQLRELLGKYSTPGEALADIPEKLPVIEIPEIQFTKISPLFVNLPKPRQTENSHPMEYFDQGWGSILYRTTLPTTIDRGLLKITEMHDWAQVFVDGKLLAQLDRRRGENVVTLSALEAGTRIDILVEAMGRVNFGSSIHDRKLITEKVELIQGTQQIELKNWNMYNLPVDYSFAQKRKYAENVQVTTAPAYYKAYIKSKQYLF